MRGSTRGPVNHKNEGCGRPQDRVNRLPQARGKAGRGSTSRPRPGPQKAGSDAAISSTGPPAHDRCRCGAFLSLPAGIIGSDPSGGRVEACNIAPSNRADRNPVPRGALPSSPTIVTECSLRLSDSVPPMDSPVANRERNGRNREGRVRRCVSCRRRCHRASCGSGTSGRRCRRSSLGCHPSLHAGYDYCPCRRCRGCRPGDEPHFGERAALLPLLILRRRRRRSDFPPRSEPCTGDRSDQTPLL